MLIALDAIWRDVDTTATATAPVSVATSRSGQARLANRHTGAAQPVDPQPAAGPARGDWWWSTRRGP